jgi:hypothetical protein
MEDLAMKRMLLIGFTLLALHTVPTALAAQAEKKPSTPDQDLINFRGGLYDGCLKGQKALGKSAKEQEAICTCVLSVWGQIPEAEVMAFAQRVNADPSAATDPAWLEKLQRLGAGDCALVGQFDDTKTLSKEELSRLGEPKAFDGFSLRLPRGFMVISGQQDAQNGSFAFGRLHADLQSATLILVTLIDLGQAPPMEVTAKDRQQLLEKFLPGFKQQRTEWTQSEPAEVELGGLRFATVDWTAKADGRGMQGTLYTTLAGSKIVTLSAQDAQPFAGDTIPLAKEVFRSFSLR